MRTDPRTAIHSSLAALTAAPQAQELHASS